MIQFSRQWAMPNKNTFNVYPIGVFVEKYLSRSRRSIDPFARDFQGADVTNDLDPETAAKYHYDAADFLHRFKNDTPFDLVIFDPPYSPRQISECYRRIGRPVLMKDTQNAAMCKSCRDAIDVIVEPGGVVLSFGWNSNGMGKSRGYEIQEIMIVAHGGAHNDTICMAEQKEASLI